MQTIVWKSGLVAVFSMAASVLITVLIVPSIDTISLLMSTVCPLAIALPVAAVTFSQNERIKATHRDLARAHAQLASAHRQLAEKASRDDMTGMLNRESFFASIESTRRRADRGALLIIDADHFKKINDNFGHLTGDKALLEIAAAIRRGVRLGDVLGRIGGEEFGVLLAGASGAEAKHVAERIRREVEMLRFKPVDERTVPLTVSIGGTHCAADASVSELMRAADLRLYLAKNAGRNLAVLGDLPAAA